MRFTSPTTKLIVLIVFLFLMVFTLKQNPRLSNRLSHFLTNESIQEKYSSKYGGTLVWSTINPPTIINPVLTSHSISSSLLSLLFDSLVRIDQHGKIVPGLAKSWEVSSDGLKYTFHLHAQVYFHDGVQFTAEDVKFTYEAIQNPAYRSHWRTGTELITKWEVIDPYTVEVHLDKPCPTLLFKLVREILPKHLYEKTSLIDNPHNYRPIGTGPFLFQSWNQKNNEITITFNKDYFEGRPFLDKIIVKTYIDNTALWAALMRGEVDLVNFLNYEDYQVLRKDHTFNTYQIPNGLYFAIVYNLHDPILYDKDLRHALSCAVDRKAIMEAGGINGVESNGPFYPQSPWINKDIEPTSYNPVRARMLLAGRGWVLNSEGILEKANKPLILTMLVASNQLQYRQMALMLRQQFAEIGIGLKIVFYEDESELTPEYLDRLKPQMWLRMFEGLNIEPSVNVLSWYSGSSEFGRLWSYKDENIDQLFVKGLNIKEDIQRAEVYQEIHALIDEDQPACFLFFSVLYHAISSKVLNTEGFFTDCMPVYLIKNWFIPKERR